MPPYWLCHSPTHFVCIQFIVWMLFERWDNIRWIMCMFVFTFDFETFIKYEVVPLIIIPTIQKAELLPSVWKVKIRIDCKLFLNRKSFQYFLKIRLYLYCRWNVGKNMRLRRNFLLFLTENDNLRAHCALYITITVTHMTHVHCTNRKKYLKKRFSDSYKTNLSRRNQLGNNVTMREKYRNDLQHESSPSIFKLIGNSYYCKQFPYTLYQSIYRKQWTGSSIVINSHQNKISHKISPPLTS